MLLAIFVLAAAFLHDALAWQHSQVFSKIGERSRIDFSSFFSNVKKYNQRDVSLSESESSFGLSEELLSSSDDDSRKLKIENDNKSWTARAILLSVSAFYGTNFGCVKILGEALEPSVAATLRFSLAALVFSPYVFDVLKTNPKLIRGGLEVGLYSAIGYYAQAISLQTSHASTAAFICSLAVIVVPILDSLFAKKKSPDSIISTLIPAVLAACGVAVLELGGTDLPGVGDLWAFLQPLFFGLGFWRIESYMKICKQPGEAQAFTGAMMSVVAVMAMVWMSHDFLLPQLMDGGTAKLVAAMSEQLVAVRDWHIVAALIWTGVVTTALTAYGENIAMRSLSAAESTVIYSTEPLWGAAFAAATLGETLGWNTFAGALLIICACLWSSIGSKIAGIGFLTTASIQEVDKIEEFTENIGANWMDLLSMFQDKAPDLS